MSPLRLILLICGSLLGVLATLVLLIGGTAGWVLYTSRPDLDGGDRLPGLTAAVTVLRGPHAIPHIFADSLADGYRALGYVHAQDRFFQMEFGRRLAAGRLAEIIPGADSLRRDRYFRTLGLYRASEAAATAAGAAARQALDAYAQGVNAWLASARHVKAPELALAAVEPEPWRPADSIAIGRLMADMLSGNWRVELLRAELATRLTPDQLADLWPDAPPGEPATLPDLAAAMRDIAPATLATAIPDVYPAGSASNAWAVDGARSATGKPLLASDPHLGFLAPGFWYLARIVTPAATRVGATLAGQPFAMIGHNGHVAWGLTTTHADTQDLFVERLDPDDPTRYLTPEGPRPFATRHETIAVRFGDPEVLTVRETRHGPVISDFVEHGAATAGDGHVLALAWPGNRADDRTADALAAINAARDAGEVVAALRSFDSPVQNVTFADAGGVIGFATAGRVPVRKAGDGMAPAPGWTGTHDWAGFVPFDALPRALAPPRGRIVNANNRVVGPDYPFLITADWPEGYRATRIGELLDGRARHRPDDFVAMQRDAVSYAARDLLPLLAGLARGATTDPAAPAMLERLTAWDGTMARDAMEPLVYMAWLRETGRRLFRDELGPAYGRYAEIRPHVLRRLLAERQTWCDDVSTPAVVENCAEITGRGLDAALALLRDRLGDDPARWRWGALHEASFRHPIFGRLPWLGSLLGTRVATDGGPFTINRGTARLADGDTLFAHIHGAGLRAVFDLADLDATRFMIASGQSGHPLSPWYVDTTPVWAEGGTLTLSGDRQSLARAAVATLQLEP